MRSTARILDRSGDSARELAGDVIRTATHLPAKSALISPYTAGRVAQQTAALTLGRSGLPALGLRLEVVARGVRLCATAYDRAEIVVAQVLNQVQVQVGPVVVLAVLAGSVETATLASLPDVPISLDDWLRDNARNQVPLRPGESGFKDYLVADLDDRLYEAPWLTELTVGTARQVLDGGAMGGVVPLEMQVATVLALGQLLGYGRDRLPLTVTPVGRGDPGAERTRSAPPTSIAGLMDTNRALESDPDLGSARVRIQRVVGTDGQGRWIVNIPGTETWDLRSPSNPVDGLTNLALIAGQHPRLLTAIEGSLALAMRQAGVRPGSEPVLLNGHSQGGIAAARLAGDPAFRRRFNVTRVVTAGSPVSRITIPPSVQVLSLEHRTDPVPRLDQAGDPDTMNRVRVRLDPVLPEGRVRPEDPRAGRPGHLVDRPIDTHSAGRYRDTAARDLAPDQGRHDPVQDWYVANREFLTGDATTYDFRLQRQLPPPPAARSR